MDQVMSNAGWGLFTVGVAVIFASVLLHGAAEQFLKRLDRALDIWEKK
jgi:hypothetical protein